jgi:hypothetical protein
MTKENKNISLTSPNLDEFFLQYIKCNENIITTQSWLDL